MDDVFGQDKKKPNNKNKDPKEIIKPKYVSKGGFKRVRLLRGFYEAEKLIQLCMKHGAYICGGYARYCASPNAKKVIPPTDIDIYCPTDEIFDTMNREFQVSFHLKINRDNPICFLYKRPDKGPFSNLPLIQLIKPMVDGHIVSKGDIETILSNFDFTVIRCAIISRKMALVDADFEHDEAQRFLRIKNIHCPISSTLRFCKYYAKGYWTSPLEVTKLFLDWEGRDQDYRDKILHFVKEANKGEGLTREDIELMERLMRVD